MEIHTWISSIPKKDFSPYLLTKLFSSLVYTFMRRMGEENPTVLQMRKLMRQKNNVPVQICEENKAQINHTSHLTEPICSFSLGLHYSIFREMVLSTPSIADDGHHERSLPAIPLAISLPGIYTHELHMTTNPGKMRVRGCRRIQ